MVGSHPSAKKLNSTSEAEVPILHFNYGWTKTCAFWRRPSVWCDIFCVSLFCFNTESVCLHATLAKSEYFSHSATLDELERSGVARFFFAKWFRSTNSLRKWLWSLRLHSGVVSLDKPRAEKGQRPKLKAWCRNERVIVVTDNDFPISIGWGSPAEME